MATLAVVILAAILGIAAFSSALAKRFGSGAAVGGAGRVVKILIILLASAAGVLMCIMSCYAQACEIFKQILAPDSVEYVKRTLKMMSGADSAFIALQTLAMTSAMISFVSCVACMFGVIIVLFFNPVAVGGRTEITKDDKEAVLRASYQSKAFLVYSRYNS